MPTPSSRLRFPVAAMLLVMLLALAAGCDDSPGPTTPTPAPTGSVAAPTATQPPPRRGGNLTLRLTADPESLNPWLSGRDSDAQLVAGLLFNGLTRLDNKLQPQPDLAERWIVSPDGTSLTFYLRADARWHDGTPVTVEDVVWSFRTIAGVAPDTSQLLRIQDTVLRVEAGPEARSVIVTLKRRFSPILADLSIPVLPSHILTGTLPVDLAQHPFNAAPVGTGPFSFDSREAGQSLTLKSNEAYHLGAPALDGVALLVAPDAGVAETAMRDGKLLLAELPPASAESIVVGGGGFRGGAYLEPGYDFVAFNLRAPRPFSDTRLRQAWALALDKRGLVFAATGGSAEPVWTDVHAHSWAHSAESARLGGQPEEARRIIAEAEWADGDGDGIVEKDGRALSVAIYVRADSETRRRAAEEMVAPLRRVGIDAKVESSDFNTAIQQRLSPVGRQPFDFDVMILGWSRTGLDPDSFALFHSSQIPTESAPGLLNYTGFSAPEYDLLALEARSTYDMGRRHELYSRMQVIIADQLPYYFLWSAKFGVAASPRLRGDIDFASPRFMWNVETWWIDE